MQHLQSYKWKCSLKQAVHLFSSAFTKILHLSLVVCICLCEESGGGVLPWVSRTHYDIWCSPSAPAALNEAVGLWVGFTAREWPDSSYHPRHMTALVATATMTVYRWHHSCWTNYQQWRMEKQRRGGAAWIPPGMTPKRRVGPPDGAFTSTIRSRRWTPSEPWPVLQQHGWEHSHTQQSSNIRRYNCNRITRSTEKIIGVFLPHLQDI